MPSAVNPNDPPRLNMEADYAQTGGRQHAAGGESPRTVSPRPNRGAANDHAMSAGRPKKSKMLLFVLTAMAVTFLGVYGWGQYRKSDSSKPLPPAAKPAATAQPLVPPEPPLRRAELTDLQAVVSQMQSSIEAIKQAQSALGADVAVLREEQDKLAQSVKSLAARRVAVAKPKVEPPPQPVAQPQPSARVLSIDTWDGKPSVSVSQGDQIKFMSEGDAIGGYVLKRADGRKQQAEFATPDGGTKRVQASEGAK